MNLLPAILVCAALLCVIAAAAFDIARFEIPDTLSIVLAALGLAFGALTPGFAWLSHLAAPVLVFTLGLLAFARGWLGGGDVKLWTATAVWTGLHGLLLQWVVVSVAGGTMLLLLLAVRRGLAGRAASLPRVLHVDAPLPYAVPIALGTIWWGLQAGLGVPGGVG